MKLKKANKLVKDIFKSLQENETIYTVAHWMNGYRKWYKSGTLFCIEYSNGAITRHHLSIKNIHEEVFPNEKVITEDQALWCQIK